ncbi:hypothetical protein BTO10_14485 [Vibrio chagasii]|uniref:DUF3265 domain-containing protein n=1 Tax=Vibrio chagasii TaxID=170679 RepID=A0A2S7VGF4_9VIBR|nr:hypothetical protein BTO10_14485 [Vibrio chagasii]
MIRNAWHFYYALRLVFKVVCGRPSHHLTGSYI